MGERTKAARSTDASGAARILRRFSRHGGRTADAECDDCGKNRLELQRRSAGPSGLATAPDLVHQVLRSPGRPLEEAERTSMETAFGHDFARVRVHSDSRAAASARAVDAEAYTVGRHVVLGREGRHAERAGSRQLLAHELAHVVQQRGLGDRVPDELAIGDPHAASEHEAERAARRISAGVADSDSPRGGSACRAGSADGFPATADAAGGPRHALVQRIPRPRSRAGSGTAPRVQIGNFRNRGQTHAENTCSLCPRPLGISSTSGKNGMELRGDVSGHTAATRYDFKRTKERATWKKVGGSWTQLTHVGPGADDDKRNTDEMLTPVNNHIYVEDRPGFGNLGNPVGDPSATEAVYKASFVETCNVKVGAGPWARSSNAVPWHSITWLEKVGGSWRRKRGENEIELGGIFVGTGLPYGLGDFPTPAPERPGDFPTRPAGGSALA